MRIAEALHYAHGINASEEVVQWCNTVLLARAKLHALNSVEIEHILDYLASDSAPKRLRRMSYKQALDGADKWSRSNQKRGRNLVDGPEDLEIVHDFLNGTKIVRLLTKKAYEREGYLMSHCVGGYSPDTTIVYSYRDAKNIPHATFEVNKDCGVISQIKGKGNGPIHPKYIHTILIFLQTIGMKVNPRDMRNLGYVHIPAEAMEVLSHFECNTKLVSILGNKYVYIGQV